MLTGLNFTEAVSERVAYEKKFVDNIHSADGRVDIYDQRATKVR